MLAYTIYHSTPKQTARFLDADFIPGSKSGTVRPYPTKRESQKNIDFFKYLWEGICDRSQEGTLRKKKLTARLPLKNGWLVGR